MELYYKKYTEKPEVVKLKLGWQNHLLHSFSNKTQNLKQTAILVGKIFILCYRICQRSRNMQGQKVVTGMILKAVFLEQIPQEMIHMDFA